MHLVTAHLHRQNQVAHALRTRDFKYNVIQARPETTTACARTIFIPYAKAFEGVSVGFTAGDVKRVLSFINGDLDSGV